jgi:hypothetical protein
MNNHFIPLSFIPVNNYFISQWNTHSANQMRPYDFLFWEHKGRKICYYLFVYVPFYVWSGAGLRVGRNQFWQAAPQVTGQPKKAHIILFARSFHNSRVRAVRGKAE